MSATDVIAARLVQAFGSKTLTLLTADGAQTVSLAIFAPSIATVLRRFYDENKRLPQVIFNDGVPASFAARLRAKPMFAEVVRWEQFYNGEIEMSRETGETRSDWLAVPVLNVKFLDTSGDVHNTRFRDGTEIPGDNVAVSDEQINAGAFQSWGVLLAAYSSPDLCFATDEGIMLTGAGVTMLERSLPYWFEKYMQPEHWFPAELNGPVTFGFPLEILDNLKTYILKRRAAEPGFFATLLGIGMFFAGFAFGASAVSSLISGVFTPATVAGSLKFASQFGLTGDTNKLVGGLKLASLATGDISSLTSSSGLMDTGGIMGDEFDWSGVTGDAFDIGADIGIDAGSIDYASFGDVTNTLSDALNAPGMYDASTMPTETAILEAPGPLDTADSRELFRQSELAAQKAEIVGPVSETQFGAITKTAPAVVSAARAAMGPQAGNIVSPATAQAGAQRAQQQANALVNTNPQEANIWSTAAQMLNLYGQYQANEIAIARAKGGALPLSPRLPQPNTGAFTRQPDGSFTVRNADGTVTTISPNGQSVRTGGSFVDELPAFVKSKTFLYIAGGAILLGVTFAMFGNNHRSNRSH